MRSEDIQVGAAYTMKIGRNAVRVTVTGGDCDGWLVETPAGRTMTIRNAERFIEPADAPETVETPPTPAEAPQAEPTPPAPTERDTDAQSAPAGETGRTMSLLDAAAHLLGESGEPMGCVDLVERAREQGLWAPARGGKTPDRTLYSAILREITTKGDASRFRKAARGRFEVKNA